MKLQEILRKAERDPDYLDELKTEEQAAQFLNHSTRTLQKWRLRGGGPRFVKISSRSIRYRRRDLIEWIEERVRAHTSQPS